MTGTGCAVREKGLAAEYRLRALALQENDAPRLPLLQRAADLDAAAPGIWSDLARAALTSGDFNGAERYSQQALKADSNDQAAGIVDAQLAAQKSTGRALPLTQAPWLRCAA